MVVFSTSAAAIGPLRSSPYLTTRRRVYLGMLIQEVVPAHLTRLWGPAPGPGPHNTPSQWAQLNSVKWAVGQWSLMTNYGLSRYRTTNTRNSPKSPWPSLDFWKFLNLSSTVGLHLNFIGKLSQLFCTNSWNFTVSFWTANVMLCLIILIALFIIKTMTLRLLSLYSFEWVEMFNLGVL